MNKRVFFQMFGDSCAEKQIKSESRLLLNPPHPFSDELMINRSLPQVASVTTLNEQSHKYQKKSIKINLFMTFISFDVK